jgi:hypothetical protein
MQSRKKSNLKRFAAQPVEGVARISAFVDWKNLDVSKQQIESRINQIRTDLPRVFKSQWKR